MRVRTSLAVLLLGLALTGCGDNENPNTVQATTTSPGAAETIDVDEDENGQARTLVVGQAIKVELKANPSTGSSWQLGELDQNIVKQNGEQVFEQDTSDGGPKPGQGGETTWWFIGINPGTTKLVLNYGRPWEKDAPPVQTYTLNLTVQ